MERPQPPSLYELIEAMFVEKVVPQIASHITMKIEMIDRLLFAIYIAHTVTQIQNTF